MGSYLKPIGSLGPETASHLEFSPLHGPWEPSPLPSCLCSAHLPGSQLVLRPPIQILAGQGRVPLDFTPQHECLRLLCHLNVPDSQAPQPLSPQLLSSPVLPDHPPPPRWASRTQFPSPLVPWSSKLPNSSRPGPFPDILAQLSRVPPTQVFGKVWGAGGVPIDGGGDTPGVSCPGTQGTSCNVWGQFCQKCWHHPH